MYLLLRANLALLGYCLIKESKDCGKCGPHDLTGSAKYCQVQLYLGGVSFTCIYVSPVVLLIIELHELATATSLFVLVACQSAPVDSRRSRNSETVISFVRGIHKEFRPLRWWASR